MVGCDEIYSEILGSHERSCSFGSRCSNQRQNQALCDEHHVMSASHGTNFKKKVIRRKRCRANRKRYVVNQFPRVVKRDIRRWLPRMLANAINSCDVRVLRGYFVACSLPQVSVVDYRRTDTGDLRLEDPVPGLSDLDSFLLMMACYIELTPDTTLTLIKADIRQYRDNDENCCDLVCMFYCTGTRLYDFDTSLEPVVYTESASVALSTDSFGGLDLSRTLANKRKVLRSVPMAAHCLCRLTLTLDAQHRIRHMHFEEQACALRYGCIPRKNCFEVICQQRQNSKWLRPNDDV